MNRQVGKGRGKVVYTDVSLNGLTLDIATKRKSEAIETISKLLDGLTLHLPDGDRAEITVELDELAFGHPSFRQAQAAPAGKSRYKISIGVGLITQLSVIARGAAADKNELRGRTKTRLLQKEVRSDGREKALGDFIFHFMLMFVMWHEVAHISLGHIDWLKQKTGLGVINEFNIEPMPENEFTQRQTLEADADRQAAIWTAAMIDDAARRNPYLRYTSQLDLFYDIGYIYGALFGFLDAIDSRPPENQRMHPDANTRLAVALAFVLDYLQRSYPQLAKQLHQQVIGGGVDALTRMYHHEKQSFNPFAVFAFMSENGKRLGQMGVRQFQHKISGSAPGSFNILGA